MEIVKTTQETVTDNGTTVKEPPKEQPVYFVMTKEVLINVINALKEIPWKMSNNILQYIDANATEVKLTQTEKPKEDEKNTETPKE